MKLFKIALSLLMLLATQSEARRHHHRMPVRFGFQIGYPVTPMVYQPYYVRPCRVMMPVVYQAPCIRPHVGFSFGSGPFGFGFSF